MPLSPSRNAILRLINASQHTACPCHGCRNAAPYAHHAIQQLRRGMASPVDAVQKEYAFEVRTTFHSVPYPFLKTPKVAASNLRFGDGVTREVGMDFKNMKARKV